jgi:hypothetical protein
MSGSAQAARRVARLGGRVSASPRHVLGALSAEGMKFALSNLNLS